MLYANNSSWSAILVAEWLQLIKIILTQHLRKTNTNPFSWYEWNIFQTIPLKNRYKNIICKLGIKPTRAKTLLKNVTSCNKLKMVITGYFRRWLQKFQTLGQKDISEQDFHILLVDMYNKQ